MAEESIFKPVGFALDFLGRFDPNRSIKHAPIISEWIFLPWSQKVHNDSFKILFMYIYVYINRYINV